MPTSSARPDHLRQYAADTAATAARSTAAVDEVARALGRHLAGGGGPGTAFPAVAAARAAVERSATLGAAARQIAAAFQAADRGPDPNGLGAAGRPVTATDLALAPALRSVAAGIADEELLAPVRFQAGTAFAAELIGLPLADQLERLSAMARSDDHEPAFAAGVLRGLGAAGLTHLVESVRTAYESATIGLTRADAALGSLTGLLRDAARTLVGATAPAELVVALRAAPGDVPYGLDLGLLRALGRTAAGRRTLRELVLDQPQLPAQAVVVIARAFAVPHRDDDQRPARSLRMLEDRRTRRWGVVAPDLPILRMLARDPVAAWGWEQSAPGRASPIAGHLPNSSPAETDALAAILEAVLVHSVRQRWAGPFRVPLLPGPADPHDLRSVVDVPALLDAAGRARPTTALSRSLAAALAAHPEAFREIAGRAAYGSTPSATLTAYFAVLAADRRALDAAIRAALEAYLHEAARVLGRTPPTAVDATELLGGLADSHGVTIALERGAMVAGHHHNAVLAFALTLVGQTGNWGSNTASKAGGPVGAAGGFVGRQATTHLTQAGADRWVDSNDGRSRQVASATARAEPYLLAVAMAQDPRWRAVVVGPDQLRGLDVVRSKADRRAFRRWLARQDPVVASPVASLVTLAA